MKKKVFIAFTIALTIVIGVVFYFTMRSSQAEVSVNASDPQVIANGKVLYNQFCASCHGEDLKGQPNWKIKKADGKLPAPPHNKDGHTWHHSDQVLFGYIKGGGDSLGLKEFKSGMPPFKSMMNDTEIWSALAYIKSRWPEKYRARQAAVSEREKQQKANE